MFNRYFKKFVKVGAVVHRSRSRLHILTSECTALECMHPACAVLQTTNIDRSAFINPDSIQVVIRKQPFKGRQG